MLRGPQHSNTAPRGGNLGKLGEVCRKFQKLAFLCEYDHGPRVSVISPSYFILIFVWWAQADARRRIWNDGGINETQFNNFNIHN